MLGACGLELAGELTVAPIEGEELCELLRPCQPLPICSQGAEPQQGTDFRWPGWCCAAHPSGLEWGPLWRL